MSVIVIKMQEGKKQAAKKIHKSEICLEQSHTLRGCQNKYNEYLNLFKTFYNKYFRTHSLIQT